MQFINNNLKKNNIIILFFSLLIVSVKWIYSFYLYDEDIFLRIIQDTGDNAYYPLIKSFSEQPRLFKNSCLSSWFIRVFLKISTYRQIVPKYFKYHRNILDGRLVHALFTFQHKFCGGVGGRRLARPPAGRPTG